MEEHIYFKKKRMEEHRDEMKFSITKHESIKAPKACAKL